MKMSQLFKSTTAMALAALVVAGPAIGQEVKLVGKDSNINVVGKLLSARDGKYLVETDIGEFIIDQALVNCEGAGCPTGLDVAFDLTIATPEEFAESLVPILADGFAASNLDAETELFDMNGQFLDTEGDHDALHNVEEFAIKLTDYEEEDVGAIGVHLTEGDDLFERLASNSSSMIFTESSARKVHRAAVSNGGGGNLRDYDQERVIAVDGYAMVVNPLNNVPSLSLDEAAKIVSGQITNWSEVGGSNAPINVYAFNEGTEGFHHLEELIFDDEGSLSPDANIVDSDRQTVTSIVDDVAGFGVVKFANKRDTRAVPLETECGIVQTPNAFNIKSEEYELQGRVTLFSRGDVDGYAREFLDFLDNDSLDGLVAKAGYIDLSIVADQQEEAMERLTADLEEGENEFEVDIVEDLLKSMNTHERLSTTFRFAPGSERLNNKGKRDMERMLRYLATDKPDRLVVVGFTDNKGPFDPNLLISQGRAESVLEQLLEAATNGELDGVEVSAKGFGELEPVACNTNSRGRATNRRVELWVEHADDDDH